MVLTPAFTNLADASSFEDVESMLLSWGSPKLKFSSESGLIQVDFPKL